MCDCAPHTAHKQVPSPLNALQIHACNFVPRQIFPFADVYTYECVEDEKRERKEERGVGGVGLGGSAFRPGSNVPSSSFLPSFLPRFFPEIAARKRERGTRRKERENTEVLLFLPLLSPFLPRSYRSFVFICRGGRRGGGGERIS